MTCMNPWLGDAAQHQHNATSAGTDHRSEPDGELCSPLRAGNEHDEHSDDTILFRIVVTEEEAHRARRGGVRLGER